MLFVLFYFITCCLIREIEATTLQIWYNRHFTDMIQLVLSTGGFYFSRTYDLSYSAQWLAENATPVFKRLPMMGRVGYFLFFYWYFE